MPFAFPFWNAACRLCLCLRKDFFWWFFKFVKVCFHCASPFYRDIALLIYTKTFLIWIQIFFDKTLTFNWLILIYQYSSKTLAHVKIRKKLRWWDIFSVFQYLLSSFDTSGKVIGNHRLQFEAVNRKHTLNDKTLFRKYFLIHVAIFQFYCRCGSQARKRRTWHAGGKSHIPTADGRSVCGTSHNNTTFPETGSEMFSVFCSSGFWLASWQWNSI